jgi:hypothetical protein
MSDAEWEIYVRSLVNESVASFWTAGDIAAYKAVGITTVNSMFWNLLFPLKKRYYDYSLTAGENNLDLPVGWHKIVRLEVAATGAPLKPIADRESPYYLAGDAGVSGPVGWMFIRGKIRPLPNPTSAMTNYLRLWYLPRATTLAELPEDLHPLVAVEAVLAARTKDENISPYLTNLRDRFEAIARKALVQFQTQAPMVLEDDYDMADL